MVFSLFGKKPSPPPRKPASAKPIAHPPAPKPASASPAASTSSSEGGLDQPPPKEELPDLDFTVSGITLTLAREEAERIELREGSARVHPVVEEAAILYANGGTENAVSVIEAALERGKLEQATEEQMWNLLFELYQILGMREAFDKRSLDYVVRFEKSAPAWTGGDTGAAASAAVTAPLCNLNGALSAASAKQFDQMQRILAKNKLVRIDVARVNSADADGCNHLNVLFAAARKLKHVLVVQNPGALVKLLKERIAIGKRENQPLWLLLLELLQQQGDQETFEEWALNYAITFEVSPPSWEAPPALPKAAQGAGAGAQPATAATSADAFSLRGEMLGASANDMHKLNEYAARHDPVEVDMGQLRRMDFVCAGMLLNTLSDLAAHGKTVHLRNVSGLVAALLSVIGINQVAEIGRRRA